MSAVEMPRYRSHKEVWALKIKDIKISHPTIEQLDATLRGENPPTIRALITPEESGYAPFGVSHEYVHRHEPKIGGYYVVYKDGYTSFSPAGAFEDGYTRI